MSTTDPKTGLPIIGAKDTRPIVVKVISNGDPSKTSIVDATTGRPIEGVEGVLFSLTPAGGTLTLTFCPLSFVMEMVDQPVNATSKTHAKLVDIVTNKPVSLVDGQEIVIDTPDGAPQCILTAKVMAGEMKVEGTEGSQEMGGAAGSGERPKRALGQKGVK